MTEKEAYVAFNLAGGYGSAKVAELAAREGSVAAAWESVRDAVARGGGNVDFAAEMRLAAKYGVAVVTPADGEYPAALLAARSHPLALYVKGSPAALSKPCVAIVGTRRATSYGLSVARNLACDLAADGWAVVSGLALGIDAEAHRGALDANGATVGVLGSALDRFYPEENRALAHEIVAKGGAVVSEFPFGRGPDAQTFPQRNHVVAGLCRGVVAVEAPRKSGTLITASLAADLGRTVMAIPGRIDSNASAGCNALIRDGARLVRDARDVQRELSELSMVCAPAAPRAAKVPAPPAPQTPAPPENIPYTLEESVVMRNVDDAPVSMDVLLRKTGLPPAKLNVACISLRMKGRLDFLPGNRVAAASSRLR
ncbi:MAG: DNA-processing protein DprA [Kiritimatiellae bacterium]|nr:DNA-processing protein DprA [Kiritimatiellia bacterium]